MKLTRYCPSMGSNFHHIFSLSSLSQCSHSTLDNICRFLSCQQLSTFASNKSMNKQQSKKPLKLQQLPPQLQQKYKNSILFAKQNYTKQKTFQFDLRKLKQRQTEKEKTIEEKLQEFKINPTEEKYLLNVFSKLSASNQGKYFTAADIYAVLAKMNIKMLKSQIDRMIWEFDEDLNKKITEKEFMNMYKKCTIDKAGAESKNLFHLTQFLMYCRPGTFLVTVQDTLELLYVRAKTETEQSYRDESGRMAKVDQKLLQKQILQKLNVEIRAIFDDEEKTPEGIEKQIGFEEYLDRINKQAIKKRQNEILMAKSALKYGVNNANK